MGKVILKLCNIYKEFPGVKALNSVNFDLEQGEVHALVGENGSGKSTLMNIISGVYQPDGGEIYLYGKPTRFKDTKDAQNKGVSMIHQELSLAPTLSIMENLFIGRQIKNKFGFIDTKAMHRKCEEILAEFNIENVRSNDIVKELSLSQMQLIEIAKAIYLNNKIIIMDEPTSSLTSAETETLFKHIEILKHKGCSIIFISHRLDEIKQIADRITVLRDGNHIITENSKNIEVKKIISSMVGREFGSTSKRTGCFQNEKILEVKNLSNKRIHDISFFLKKGEVLGITGLVGSGRTELLKTIFGDMRYDSGEIFLFDKKVEINSISSAINHGIGLIPEGRKAFGLFPDLSVQENVSLIKRKDLSRLGIINAKKVGNVTNSIKNMLKIKTPSMQNQIRNLSGGNQQKAIIGRWLINEPKILLLDEPTHGIDIGAKAEIYEIIDKLAKQGVSILLISSEFEEIMMLCDRIIVMYQGKINGELVNSDITQEQIMTYATNQV